MLAVAGTADVVDALLALVVLPADQVLTSDPANIAALLDGREVPATTVHV